MHEDMAKLKGYTDGLAGLRLEDCPYERKENVDSWRKGWSEGVAKAELDLVKAQSERA